MRLSQKKRKWHKTRNAQLKWQKNPENCEATHADFFEWLINFSTRRRHCPHATEKKETSCIDRLLIVSKRSSERKVNIIAMMPASRLVRMFGDEINKQFSSCFNRKSFTKTKNSERYDNEGTNIRLPSKRERQQESRQISKKLWNKTKKRPKKVKWIICEISFHFVDSTHSFAGVFTITSSSNLPMRLKKTIFRSVEFHLPIVSTLFEKKRNMSDLMSFENNKCYSLSWAIIEMFTVESSTL